MKNSTKDIEELRRRNSIILNFIPIQKDSMKDIEQPKTSASRKNLNELQGVQGSSIVKVEKERENMNERSFGRKKEEEKRNDKIKESEEEQDIPLSKIVVVEKDRQKAKKPLQSKRKGTYLQIDQENFHNALLDRIKIKENFRRKRNNLKTFANPLSQESSHHSPRKKNLPLPYNSLRKAISPVHCRRKHKISDADNFRS